MANRPFEDSSILSDTFYWVDSIAVPWGLRLEEVRELLKDKKPLRVCESGSNFKVQCCDAMGFAVSEVSMRAPANNRPVMQVSYELVPQDPMSKTVDPDFWVNTLTRYLGHPLHQSQPAIYPIDGSNSGRVVFSSSWVVGNIRVTLSCYGGVRVNEEGAISIAGLYLTWENAVLFAAPYLEKVQRLEESLVPKKPTCQIVNLGQEQRPYYLPDYNYQNPHAAATDYKLRRAQRVLTSPNLFDTPKVLADMMGARSVMIWQPQGVEDFVLSNKWDSVVVYMDAARNNVSWSNILPAKGSGGMWIGVNGLSISDNHSSEILTNLVSELSICQNKDIECFTDYDC